MAPARQAMVPRVPPIEAAVRAGLVREAACGGRHPSGLLVLVSPPEGGRLLDDITAAITAADPGGVAVEDGAELSAELLAVSDADRGDWLWRKVAAARSILILGVDRLAAPATQHACAMLLDRAAAAGTFVCVSLAVPPARAGLVAALETRLVAGLVVPLPTATAAATPTGTVSVARVIRATARQRGVATETLVGHGRQRSVAEVRGLAMYLARRLTGRSLGAIGRAFGGRDHTTVMRSIRGVCGRIRTDAAFAGDVERLATTIAGRTRRRRRTAG